MLLVAVSLSACNAHSSKERENVAADNEELLNNRYTNSSLSFVSALVLGWLTAISPRPMSKNITAIDFIGKDLVVAVGIVIVGLVFNYVVFI